VKLYRFPRWYPDVYRSSDAAHVIDFWSKQHLLLTTPRFNLPTTDHLRPVFLAAVDVLDDAITRWPASSMPTTSSRPGRPGF